MADLPILFSSPMIRALDSGRKTQTRRIVNPQPMDDARYGGVDRDGLHFWYRGFVYGKVRLPQVGDRLWVRESYFQRGYWESVDTQRTRAGRQKWRFVSVDEEILFEAPIGEAVRLGRHAKDPATVAWHKRLGRFMPRRYSRFTLTVTDVRVQRLQEITCADAVAEGAIDDEWLQWREDANNVGLPEGSTIEDERDKFADLWRSINGGPNKPDPWNANPWVSARTFTVARRNIDEAA